MFFKARLVEVCEREYAMLDVFPDTTNANFFNKVELPFDQPEELGELDGRTQLQLLNVVMRTLKRKDDLNTTKEKDWKTIFYHGIEEMDRADRERDDVRYSTTQRYTIVTLMKSWMGWLWCFFDL